jgi:hypothetical protein
MLAALERKLRPHRAEGAGDATHRTPTEAVVAFETARKRMCADDACHESRGCPAVAAVERDARRDEAAQPTTVNPYVIAEWWHTNA